MIILLQKNIKNLTKEKLKFVEETAEISNLVLDCLIGRITYGVLGNEEEFDIAEIEFLEPHLNCFLEMIVKCKKNDTKSLVWKESLKSKIGLIVKVLKL